MQRTHNPSYSIKHTNCWDVKIYLIWALVIWFIEPLFDCVIIASSTCIFNKQNIKVMGSFRGSIHIRKANTWKCSSYWQQKMSSLMSTPEAAMIRCLVSVVLLSHSSSSESARTRTFVIVFSITANCEHYSTRSKTGTLWAQENKHWPTEKAP